MVGPITVAEFSINHMGNLNACFKMIEKAKWAGADYVKLKKKNVLDFYTKSKLNSRYKSPYGQTFGEYREMFEFTLDDFKRIDDKCKEVGIKWFSTVHDFESLSFFINNFDIPLIKIASIDMTKTSLLECILKDTDKNVVLSIGGQDLDRILETVDMFNDGRLVFVQQCTSIYPCPTDQLNLYNIVKLKKIFEPCKNVYVGYSGHEVGYIPSVIAVTLGADIIERHFCLSRDSFVHHIECGLEPQEFKDMVDCFNSLPKMLKCDFGMKELEKSFLLNATYGTDFWTKDGEQL